VHQLRLVVTLVVVILASITDGQLLTAAENPNSPQPYSQTFVVNPGDPNFPATCSVPISITLQGKSKSIDLAADRDIMIFPASTVTISSNSSEVSFSLTGSFHDQTEPDGSTVTRAIGRNLLIDPIAGVVLAIGDFSFAFDSAGNLIQPLAGNGQLVDICSLI
jgi:hypothetical protein